MLLAYLGKTPSYPKLPEGLAADTAELCLLICALIAVWMVLRSESVRRGLTGLTDPRVFAVLRIGFGLMTLVNFLNLFPYWELLWSDEGLFTMEYARDRLGRSALRGWTPDEGFLDLWAVAAFLWNKPSVLYLHGSPAFLTGYMVVFFLLCLLYSAGVFSRVTGVLVWLLMSGIYNRNALYWEGTDTVYRCCWFILLFARTGHAWSFDNWWRCRRLRKRRKLHEGTGALPLGQEPVYRLVPGWTRYLFMLQLSLIYINTGAVKTGVIWKRGDALYYALNMDHFYRFELATQYVSYSLGTNVFRVMTWVTLWWERTFPIILLGMILKFGLDHRDEPWYRDQQRVRWRVWLGRAAAAGAYAAVYRLVWTAYPWSVKTLPDQTFDYEPGLRLIHVLFLAVGPALVVLWAVLGRWRLRVPFLPRKVGRITLPAVVIDQGFLRRWLLGRRIWLGLGVLFHGFLILFMNIGMFPFIMLMAYAAFVSGEEWVRIIRASVQALRRVGLGRLVPLQVESYLVPAEPASSVRPRGGRIPDLLLLVFAAAGAYLLTLRTGGDKPEWFSDAGWVFLGAIMATAVVMLLRKPSRRDAPESVGGGPALIPTALGRTVVFLATFWHGSAIVVHLFPSAPILATFRSQVRIHDGWLRGTSTTQSWNMFSPNPPSANSFMITVVVERDGDRWDLQNNAYSQRPNPWIINDRMRKMQRRMIGKGQWYLRYWAEYHCRQWALRTGELPYQIIIDKVVTRIPGPELVREKGPYDPKKLRPLRTNVKKFRCKQGGDLPVYMKRRHGLPVTEEELARETAQGEQDAKKWENRREAWRKRRDWGGRADPPKPVKPRKLTPRSRIRD